MLRAPHRLALVTALLVPACAAPSGPGPQQASFPPGQRVTHSGTLTLEMSEAHYDLREVAVTVNLTNDGETPLRVERQGVLLAYGDLEFPVATSSAPELTDQTALAPGATQQLELRFAIEQPLLEAATLHVMSIHQGEDRWLEPMRLAVPPPAAFVELAQPNEE